MNPLVSGLHFLSAGITEVLRLKLRAVCILSKPSINGAMFSVQRTRTLNIEQGGICVPLALKYIYNNGLPTEEYILRILYTETSKRKKDFLTSWN